jgi:hypothetical protein
MCVDDVTVEVAVPDGDDGGELTVVLEVGNSGAAVDLVLISSSFTSLSSLWGVAGGLAALSAVGMTAVSVGTAVSELVVAEAEARPLGLAWIGLFDLLDIPENTAGCE